MKRENGFGEILPVFFMENWYRYLTNTSSILRLDCN